MMCHHLCLWHRHVLTFVLLICIAGCRESVVYETTERIDHDEIVWHESLIPTVQTNNTRSVLKWKSPAHWQEVLHDEFQIAKFKIEGYESLTCSISQFEGSAGGLFANINRWHLQLKAEAVSEENLQSVLKSLKSQSGLHVQWVEILSPPEHNQATLGAVLMLESHSVFIKLSGAKDVVFQEKDSFLSLLTSLEMNDVH